MSVNRHSYVGFYPSDWLAGTARMTRLHKSVYFDVCCFIWDQNRACPAAELPLMLGDIPNWRDLVTDLIDAGKLVRQEDGSICNERALSEAKKAFDLWQKKSAGGKRGAAKTNTPDGTADATPAGTPDGSSPKTAATPDAEPEPDTLPNGKGASAPDPVKVIFDMGIALLADAGLDQAKARRLIGKWRRDYSDQRLTEALFDCKAKAISDPVSWMPKRMQNASPQSRFAEIIAQKDGFY